MMKLKTTNHCLVNVILGLLTALLCLSAAACASRPAVAIRSAQAAAKDAPAVEASVEPLPSPTPRATETQAPTQTPAPTNTPTPLPTNTAAPTPSTGGLSGKVVRGPVDAAVAGAGVVLCRVTTMSCQIKPAWSATTSSAGHFEINDLPGGSYVLLYNPTRLPAGDLEGVQLDLSDKSRRCLGNMLTGKAGDCQGFVPFFGKGGFQLQGGSELSITSDGITLDNGSVVSKQYDLYLDVRSGKPLTVSLQAGETTTLTVSLWYEASSATPTARPAATRQPSPTPTPCLPNASFGTDVTIPDGTRFAPGTRFTKTWRVRSSGCAAWPTGSSWVFVSGERLGAPASRSVASVRPGSTADVSVEMIAPSALGTYRGVWRMQDDKGRPFGDPLWVEIVVGSPLPQVRIPVSNETGGTLTLSLTGPATYNFTLATGMQYITVVSGMYSFVGRGCGGATKTGMQDLTDDSDDWRWWCN